jgi:methyl-accepting chemotaxis protein
VLFANAARRELDAINRSLAVIHFRPDGTVLHANENFLKLMGYALDEISGKPHRLFVDRVYAESSAYREFWERLGEGEDQAAQFKRYGKYGREVWIEATYVPVRNTRGQVCKVVKYATDITQQKLKNADLAGQADAIGKSQAIVHFNLDGTILSANQNFLDATGYTLEEVQGRHHRMFVGEDYARSEEYRAFWARLNEGQFSAAQFKRYGKDGRELWIEASYNPIFDMNGKPFKVVKYATDITAQRLRNADFEGQTAAISRSQCVIHFDLDGTIITANDNFLQATGYTLEEVRG